jgi:lipopolysaccharide/colanic/teichoic acid biosynthesis glycosyltransferase
MSIWLDLRIILKTIPVLIWQALECRAGNRAQKSIQQAVPMTESLNGEVKKI